MIGQDLGLHIDTRTPRPVPVAGVAGRDASTAGLVAIMERDAPGRYGLPVDGGPAGTWGSRPAAGVRSVSVALPSAVPDDAVPAAGPAPDESATPSTAPDVAEARAEAGPSIEPPAADASADPDPVSEQTRLLLRLMIASQERDQRHLCDVFHDGPIQDFTAVLLACSAVRRSLRGQDAERLADVEAQLYGAIATLRLPSPAFRAGNNARMILEAALGSRVQGPLTRALDSTLDVDDPAPTRAEIAELLGALQILLLESDPLRPAAHAAVTIRSGGDGLTMTLQVTPDPLSATASPDATRDALARTERLARAAALTGAHLTEESPGGPWWASLAWPRPQPAPPLPHSRIEQRPGLAAYQRRPAGDGERSG